jgi:hypothetical protein
MLGLLLALFLSVGCDNDSSPASPNEPIQPACANPVPLSGKYDPRAPGYIVVYHADVNAAQETTRLAALYAFTPRSVWTSALQGFAADLTPEVVAAVRCEATVDYVEYDALVQGNAPAR